MKYEIYSEKPITGKELAAKHGLDPELNPLAAAILSGSRGGVSVRNISGETEVRTYFKHTDAPEGQRGDPVNLVLEFKTEDGTKYRLKLSQKETDRVAEQFAG